MLAYDQKYINFDTETEGLNYRYSRPWEFSYLKCQGTKVQSERQIYIDVPKLDIPEFVQRLTNFNQQKYDDTKVSARDAWEEVEALLKDDSLILVGQNILFFDVWMVPRIAEMAGVSLKGFDFSFMERFMDTRFLAVAWKNGLDKPRDGDYLNWFYKLHHDDSLKRRGVGQAALLKALAINFDPNRLHDGLYDVGMNWKIFLELKKILKL